MGKLIFLIVLLIFFNSTLKTTPLLLCLIFLLCMSLFSVSPYVIIFAVVILFTIFLIEGSSIHTTANP